MTRLEESYCRYPRAILWLLRAGDVTIGGEAPDSQPAFGASVAAFYLSKRPVTNEQYEAFDPGHVRSALSAGDDDPATAVSFHRAREYCEWYARISRKPIRLPSEMEWEFACRAGTSGRCFCGDDDVEDHVWDIRNSGGAVPDLRRKKPNPAGLLGMLGGVWEWTSSLYRPYPAVAGDGRDEPGAAGPRVLRGGSVRCDRTQLGCGVRRAAGPGFRAGDVGFRVARSL